MRSWRKSVTSVAAVLVILGSASASASGRTDGPTRDQVTARPADSPAQRLRHDPTQAVPRTSSNETAGRLPRASSARAAADWQPGPERYDVGKQENLPVVMDDGKVLRADLYFPVDRKTGKAARGRFPSLLTQTPYGKSGAFAPYLGGAGPNYLVKRGYLGVVLDVRGRGASQGDFSIWSEREARDGVAAAEWASKLPNSSGKVGLFGISYMGITQLKTAGAAPKGSPIKAIVPSVAINDIAQDAFYGGMPNGGFGLLYAGLFGATGIDGLRGYFDPRDPADLVRRAPQVLLSSGNFSAKIIRDFVVGGPLAFDDGWEAVRPANTVGNIARNGIPTLLIGGWYDVMTKGPLMNYVALQNAVAGRPLAAQLPAGAPTDPRFQVAMGPWTHLSVVNELTNQWQLRWFDRFLKGIRNGVDRPAGTVHLANLGTNGWLDAPTWPVPQARYESMYLNGAKSPTRSLASNNGSLAASPDADGGSDLVAWAPVSNPCSQRLKVQTAGLLDMLGNLSSVCGTGTGSYAEVGGLSYTSRTWASARTISGPIGATLYASSTARNAEFIVNLGKVHVDGAVESITSGALIASQRALLVDRTWRDDAGDIIQAVHPVRRGAATPIRPGEVVKYEIAVIPTTFTLAPGERLRVTISTSDMPYVFTGLNLVPDLLGGVYSIQHSARYPSKVVVPILGPGAVPGCDFCRLR